MTATYPPRVCPETGLRWGRVYGWDAVDHASWMADKPTIVPNDYVGQSRQEGRARENQHRDAQPFSDLLVGSPRILWEGYCTDGQLDETERRFIQDVPLEQRPRLNYLLNEDNPRRIPKWTLKEQRHERDARRGDPPWEPTAYRPQAYGYMPAPRRSGWAPRDQKLALWFVGWLSTALIVWGELTRHTSLDWPWCAGAGCIVGAVAMVWGVWRKPDSWPMWRRRFKKVRRWLR